MYNSKSLTERLRNLESQNNLIKANLRNTSSYDEYPRLRRPNPATLLKIQGQQKSACNISTSMISDTEGIQNVEVPLRQEFINQKKHVEQEVTDLLKKYAVNRNMLEKKICSPDSVKTLPFKLHTECDVRLNEAASSNPHKKIFIKSLNCREQLLVNIFYAKIKAHPNGFFAENLPGWYKQTFDKELDLDWLEVLQASNEFEIEEILNKIVVYVKVDPITKSGLNSVHQDVSTIASGKKDSMHKTKTECDVGTESSVSFVRYKHLQKSYREYS